MSETVRLKASDGHELDAYVSSPNETPLAGLVVIQEDLACTITFVRCRAVTAGCADR